jgi:hypothetical protein
MLVTLGINPNLHATVSKNDEAAFKILKSDNLSHDDEKMRRKQRRSRRIRMNEPQEHLLVCE